MSTRVDVRYGRPRFRPTVWPERSIAAPPLAPVQAVEVVDDWILWPKQDPSRITAVELPEDFYLRELMELEFDNLDAVAELVSGYGYFCAFELEDLDPAVRLERALPTDAPTHD